MATFHVDIAGQDLDVPSWSSDADPIWVDVRPNLRRISTLAGDVLAALNKSRDIGGKGRNESEDVRLASAWLQAHHCGSLVIVNAQRLHPRVLASLTGLAVRAGVDLYLLHRPPINDATHRAIMRRADQAIELADVPRPMAHRATITLEPDTDAVPTHDFHVFPAAVEALLPPEVADRVSQEFHTTATDLRQRIESSGECRRSLASELVAMIESAPTDPVLTTRVRSVQRVAWDHDLHISVDLTQLLNSQERPRVPAADAAPLLLAYRQPYRSIAWLLANYNVGIDEATALPLSAVSAPGTTITTATGSIEIPAALTPALRAQLFLREAEGASRNDPLLPYATKTIANAITGVSLDLGLPAHGRLAERRTVDPERWLRRLGITIRNLP